jgi:hypothetical protein
MLNLVLRPLKYLWASPNTVLGLSFLPLTLLTGGRARLKRGVFEISGGFTRFFLARTPVGAAAMCLGHVILGRDAWCLYLSRNHEHVHVRHYERWGPLFLPAYFLSSFLAWRRGQHFYLDNRFEREAYGAEDSGLPDFS